MGQPVLLDDVQRLVQGGFNQKQAQALVKVINTKMSDVLTKDEFDAALARQAEIFRNELSKTVQILRSEQKDLQIKVTEEISKLRTEMSDLKVYVKDFHHQITENISKLRVEMSDMRSEITETRAEMRTEIAGMRTEIAGIKTTIAEKQNTLILQIAGLLTLFTAVVGVIISFVG